MTSADRRGAHSLSQSLVEFQTRCFIIPSQCFPNFWLRPTVRNTWLSYDFILIYHTHHKHTIIETNFVTQYLALLSALLSDISYFVFLNANHDPLNGLHHPLMSCDLLQVWKAWFWGMIVLPDHRLRENKLCLPRIPRSGNGGQAWFRHWAPVSFSIKKV